MRFVKGTPHLACASVSIRLMVCIAALMLTGICAQAQGPSSSGNPARAPAASLEPQWSSLTAAQREALAPLAEIWSTMSEGHRRKWVKLASTMPSLPEAGRNKLHERMEEWAKLSRKEREQARLNYARSKTEKSNHSADWQAYQALSDEERQKLAATAPRIPPGATYTIKPIPATRLIKVPVTRHTPLEQRVATTTRMGLNRATLLPQRNAVTSPASQGADAPVKP